METLSLLTTRRNGSETITGSYPSDVLRRQVTEWIKYCLQTKHNPPLSKPLTIHLDALLEASIERESLVAVSFQAFQILVEQMKALGVPDTIMPSLYIPLECTDALAVGPFNAQALIKQIDYNEPPSLYLTERALQTKLWPIEQYVFPLQASDFLDNSEGIYAYYNAMRGKEDIKNNWEYGRSITAEYYAPAYQVVP